MSLDKRTLDKLIALTPSELDDWIGAVAEDIVNDVKLIFQPGTGRVYQRGGTTHQASAPGQPPAVDTGALRASIHATKLGPRKYQVADGVVYGVELEIGRTRMRPRPFMGPVIESWRLGKLEKHAQRMLAQKLTGNGS